MDADILQTDSQRDSDCGERLPYFHAIVCRVFGKALLASAKLNLTSRVCSRLFIVPGFSPLLGNREVVRN